MASTSSIALLTACLGPFLSSQLYSPSNPGSGFISYNWLKTSANDRIPKYPTAILLLPNISFVSQAVTCARTSGIQPVVRSGGHSSEGSSSLSDKLIIDLSYCNKLVSIFESPVGSGNFQAKFEAGMKLGQIYSTLFNAGQWTITGGICPYVGAGGHLTGGGEGMITRKYGLGIDQLTAVDVVLADGRAVTTNSSSYSDLFWALRGGGGASFGVVTHFTANLFKVPTSSMFFLKFSCAAEVLNLWQTFFVTAPNELSAQIRFSSSDTNINGQYLGPMTGPNGLQTLMTNAGILTMQSLIWHDFKTCSGLNARAYVIGGLDCSAGNLNLLATVPIEPNPRDGTKTKTDNFNSLMPASVLNAVTNMLLSDSNTVIYGHSLGGDGVFASLSATATPFSDRSAWHTMEYHYDAPLKNSYYPGSTSYIWLNTLSELVKPYTSGRKYLNYQDFDLPSYFGIYYWGWDNFQRLVAVKNKYDPTNFFNNPQSVPLSINFTSFAPTMVSSSVPWNPTGTPSVRPSACQNNVLSQCGGANYVGSVCCPVGSCCTYSNFYWSDCQPSAVACPTAIPSGLPSASPTSSAPVCAPTRTPSAISTATPSCSPLPSAFPSVTPSIIISTVAPSSSVPNTSPVLPIVAPSTVPTPTPSILPSGDFTVTPSIPPIVAPSIMPTSIVLSTSPVITSLAMPIVTPSAMPTVTPSAMRTGTPSAMPTVTPSAMSTGTPSAMPTVTPSAMSTGTPSAMPIVTPSNPTLLPSIVTLSTTSPTEVPTGPPEFSPSAAASLIPSISVSTATTTHFPSSANPSSSPTAVVITPTSSLVPSIVFVSDSSSLAPIAIAVTSTATTTATSEAPTIGLSAITSTAPSLLLVTSPPTMYPTVKVTHKPSPIAPSLPRISPTPSSSQRPKTTKPSSTAPMVSTGAATTLQFTQELALTIPDGCASLAVDQNGQRALQLTTARYLQVSPTNVTYMRCKGNTDQWSAASSSISRSSSLSSGNQFFEESSIATSVTANLRVQTFVSLTGDANQILSDLQRKIQLAVDSRNFTRSLITVSKALHANATVFATVTGASASSSSVVTFQTPPTVAPTQIPVASTVAPMQPALLVSNESTISSSPSLPLVFGLVGGAVLLAICAGYMYYLLQIKHSSSSGRKERQPSSEDEKHCDVVFIPGIE